MVTNIATTMPFYAHELQDSDQSHSTHTYYDNDMLRNVLTPPSSNEDSSFSPNHMMSPGQTYHDLDTMQQHYQQQQTNTQHVYGLYPGMPELDMSTYVTMATVTCNAGATGGAGSNEPRLVILEEPTPKFRFRYKSEMAGTHGSINGAKSDKGRKTTYPTVELQNYSGRAKIRCSIYQCNTRESFKPHAHRLVMKSDKVEDDDPHHKYVSDTEGYVATFPGMGIIHTAKRNVVPEIDRKKRNLYREELSRQKGVVLQLTKKREIEIKNESEADARSINLNSVVLKFEAFKEDNQILIPLCSPVYSQAINNLKSAFTGELKIVRMDHTSSSVIGEKEIILLVEKVTKKNIKIRFFEKDDEDNTIWSDYGQFSEIDVHHQYAIVFRTPRYRDLNIDQPRKVFIELVRPSDNETSEAREFMYTPKRRSRPGVKRARCDFSSSSSSMGSGDLVPVMISTMNHFPSTDKINSEELQRNVQNVTDEEFRAVMAGIGARKFFEEDGAQAQEQKRALQLAVLEGDLNKFKFFLQYIENGLESLLSHTNCEGETVLHQLIGTSCHAQIKAVVKINPSIVPKQDADGNTALHLAIDTQEPDAMMQLLPILLEQMDVNHVNIENYNRFTALFLAVKNNNLAAVKVLCECGANVSNIDRRNGRTALHHAIINRYVDIVKYLLDHTNISVDSEDFQNLTPMKYSQNLPSKPDKDSMVAMLSNAMNNRGIVTERECSDIEEDEEDSMDYEEEEVKLEPISDDCYGKVEEFTTSCLKELSKILNRPDKINQLADGLDMGHLMDTNLLENKDPVKILLCNAIACGAKVLDIKQLLHNINEEDAVKCIERMVRAVSLNE